MQRGLHVLSGTLRGRPQVLLARRLKSSVAQDLQAAEIIEAPVLIEEVSSYDIARAREIAQAAEHSMPRYPALSSPAGVLRGLDYMSTGVFAVSGSITAATAGMDSLGCVIVGTVTAVGGGTIRDALILNRMPFWTVETEYLYISALAALGAFLAWPLIEPAEGGLLKRPGGKEGSVLTIGDSLGVGAFATIGAMNGVRLGCASIVSALCGVSAIDDKRRAPLFVL